MGLYPLWLFVMQSDLCERGGKKTSWVPVSICLLERHLQLCKIKCQRNVGWDVYVELIK